LNMLRSWFLSNSFLLLLMTSVFIRLNPCNSSSKYYLFPEAYFYFCFLYMLFHVSTSIHTSELLVCFHAIHVYHVDLEIAT
jgi:hypothetical protein